MGNKDKQLELPQEEELAIALAETDYVLMKTYQYDLPQYPVLPLLRTSLNGMSPSTHVFSK